MRNFQLLGTVDVLPLTMALQAKPELWNQHRYRTTYNGTPHGEVDDILLRFSSLQKMADPSDIQPVIQDLAPVFFPAWDELPQVKPIIFDLMRRLEGVALGRVVISRLAPGGRVAPHADDDGDYADRNDGRRLHIAVQGLPGSLYHCGGETTQMLTGQVWWFNHKLVHCIENNSADDRIHLMVDLQVAG